MIMSEKPNDGTVAMHYGDIEDADYLAAEDYLPTLPNTVSFCLIFPLVCNEMLFFLFYFFIQSVLKGREIYVPYKLSSYAKRYCALCHMFQ